MESLQQFFSQLLSNAANALTFGYAFGAGMVSAVNPCGFAMLPAYLGLFLGSRNVAAAHVSGSTASDQTAGDAAIHAQAGRAILVALAVTAGFVLLFGGVGLVIAAGGRLIVQWVPWVALGIGFVLVALGVAMLAGRHLSASFAARLASRLGEPNNMSAWGFLVFGLAYATASLSCTLPIFLTVVGGSLTAGGFGSAALQFVSYALGMGLVILMLTLSTAMLKGAAVKGMRKVLPYVERASALLLVVAGSYIVYYWLIKGDLIGRLK